jgi:serine O-acetyltransferase
MKIEITREELSALIRRQLNHLFILREGAETDYLEASIDPTLSKIEHCFKHTANRYYHQDGQAYFNPFHSGQYCIFLYFLSRTISLNDPDYRTLADRVYFLNKALNAIDLFYEVELPDVFALDHPVGTVLGRAQYGKFFTFNQNNTVGENKGIYPRIGENVYMASGSKLIGDSTVGDNVMLSANSYVKDADIPSCSLVFGSSPNLIIKSREPEYFTGSFV